MKKYILPLVTLLLSLSACNEKEPKEIIKEVPQPVDSLIIRSYTLEQSQTIEKPLDAEGNFAPISLLAQGDTMYIGDLTSKTVYAYNTKTKQYTQKFRKESRTEPRDISVQGDLLYIACGDSREVQIFNKHSGQYLTRLGTGAWTGNVSYATNVCANEKYIFVRDSKVGIRVFETTKVNLGASNNNSYYLNLNNDEQNAPVINNLQYSMEVAGDSLYALNINKNTLYIYDLKDLDAKKTNYKQKIIFENQKIHAFDYDPISKNFCFAMEQENAYQIVKVAKNNVAQYPWATVSQEISMTQEKVAVRINKQGFAYPKATQVNLYDVRKDSIVVITPRQPQ